MRQTKFAWSRAAMATTVQNMTSTFQVATTAPTER